MTVWDIKVKTLQNHYKMHACVQLRTYCAMHWENLYIDSLVIAMDYSWISFSEGGDKILGSGIQGMLLLKPGAQWCRCKVETLLTWWGWGRGRMPATGDWFVNMRAGWCSAHQDNLPGLNALKDFWEKFSHNLCLILLHVYHYQGCQ